jgi:hypothetical protein
MVNSNCNGSYNKSAREEPRTCVKLALLTTIYCSNTAPVLFEQPGDNFRETIYNNVVLPQRKISALSSENSEQLYCRVFDFFFA